jgi:uncharacterized protein YjbI with pentapeptide repeats
MSFEETKEYLKKLGEDTSTTTEGTILLKKQIFANQEEAGFKFFRLQRSNKDMSNLYLPGIYIGRCELTSIRFRNADFTNSIFCWDYFIDCDFSDSNFSYADLRASIFENCCFDRCIMNKADFRHSSFYNCSFKEADVFGAISLKDEVYLKKTLSNEQLANMVWVDDYSSSQLNKNIIT